MGGLISLCRLQHMRLQGARICLSQENSCWRRPLVEHSFYYSYFFKIIQHIFNRTNVIFLTQSVYLSTCECQELDWRLGLYHQVVCAPLCLGLLELQLPAPQRGDAAPRGDVRSERRRCCPKHRSAVTPGLLSGLHSFPRQQKGRFRLLTVCPWPALTYK